MLWPSRFELTRPISRGRSNQDVPGRVLPCRRYRHCMKSERRSGASEVCLADELDGRVESEKLSGIINYQLPHEFQNAYEQLSAKTATSWTKRHLAAAKRLDDQWR